MFRIVKLTKIIFQRSQNLDSNRLTVFYSTAGLLKPDLTKNVCNYLIFLDNILEFFDLSLFELLNKMLLFLGAPEQGLTGKIDVF